MKKTLLITLLLILFGCGNNKKVYAQHNCIGYESTEINAISYVYNLFYTVDVNKKGEILGIYAVSIVIYEDPEQAEKLFDELKNLDKRTTLTIAESQGGIIHYGDEIISTETIFDMVDFEQYLSEKHDDWACPGTMRRSTK